MPHVPELLALQALLVLLIAGGLLALGFAVWHGRAIRGVLGLSSTDVISLATGTTGPVSITGRARRADESLTSPFTGTECLALEYEVEELRHTGNAPSWVEIDSRIGAVPFLVDDGTGSVLVDPSQVRLGLDESETVRVDGGERPPEHIQAFIERNEDIGSEERSLDLSVIELNVGNDRKYVERRLDSEETVTVFGQAAARPGISTHSGQVNAVITAGSSPLVISETTPYRTVLRVFWPVLVAGLTGLGALGAAVVVLML